MSEPVTEEPIKAFRLKHPDVGLPVGKRETVVSLTTEQLKKIEQLINKESVEVQKSGKWFHVFRLKDFFVGFKGMQLLWAGLEAHLLGIGRVYQEMIDCRMFVSGYYLNHPVIGSVKYIILIFSFVSGLIVLIPFFGILEIYCINALVGFLSKKIAGRRDTAYNKIPKKYEKILVGLPWPPETTGTLNKEQAILMKMFLQGALEGASSALSSSTLRFLYFSFSQGVHTPAHAFFFQEQYKLHLQTAEDKKLTNKQGVQLKEEVPTDPTERALLRDLEALRLIFNAGT